MCRAGAALSSTAAGRPAARRRDGMTAASNRLATSTSKRRGATGVAEGGRVVQWWMEVEVLAAWKSGAMIEDRQDVSRAECSGQTPWTLSLPTISGVRVLATTSDPLWALVHSGQRSVIVIVCPAHTAAEVTCCQAALFTALSVWASSSNSERVTAPQPPSYTVCMTLKWSLKQATHTKYWGPASSVRSDLESPHLCSTNHQGWSSECPAFVTFRSSIMCNVVCVGQHR